jgi:hypothetical protein
MRDAPEAGDAKLSVIDNHVNNRAPDRQFRAYRILKCERKGWRRQSIWSRSSHSSSTPISVFSIESPTTMSKNSRAAAFGSSISALPVAAHSQIIQSIPRARAREGRGISATQIRGLANFRRSACASGRQREAIPSTRSGDAHRLSGFRRSTIRRRFAVERPEHGFVAPARRDRMEQPLLVAEQFIERRERAARAFHDFGEACAFIALFEEQGLGRIENGALPPLARRQPIYLT